LRQRLVESDACTWTLDGDGSDRRRLRFIAGMDISFFSSEHDPDDQRACAALVVFERDLSGTLAVVWEDFEFVVMRQPYIAGFLAFREVPHLQALLERLRVQRPDIFPDVILVDGNGVLHPQGFGCASHMGVVCDACVIGVAKNLHVIDGLSREDVRRQVELVGQGGHVPLVGASGRVWGAALLPDPPKRVAPKHMAKDLMNPIFVSVGHRVSLQTCLRVVDLCCVSRREPEPTRIADIRSRERIRQVKAVRTLFGALQSLSEQAADVPDPKRQELKHALKDARSVVADKELLKPATKALAALELGAEAAVGTRQTKFAQARAEALARLQPASALGLDLPGSRIAQRFILPTAIGTMVVLAVLMCRRRV